MSPDTKLPLEELRALLEKARGNPPGSLGYSVAWRELGDALVNHADALLSAAEERDTLKARLNEQVERAEKAEAECLEQARVNGMGMEREAALIARAEKAEAALAEQVTRVEKYRAALEDYACAGSPDACRVQALKDGSCVRMDCGRVAHDALSTDPSGGTERE